MMVNRSRNASLAAATLALAIAGFVRAQSSEYRLDESRQWVTVTPEAQSADASLITDARRRLAEDDPAGAQAILDPWIETNRRAGNRHMAEALLIRGDALLAQDREFMALYDYEEICKNHRESDAFTTAVERELGIAIRYANGLRLRIFGIRWGEPEDVLVELFLRVSERLPRSQAAERAMIELADYYYRQRELAQAKDVYVSYLDSFPNGPNAIRARERRINCDVGRFKGPRYNAAALIDAKVQIEQFQRRYPAEAEATGLNSGLASRLDESMA
ncbi:MAG: outer membrane protein assembly factor BamD, partial [Phycisphaerae bacterium]|nr:outer membrane protein assembly factor BamD [Phycisphaerae bacterium]